MTSVKIQGRDVIIITLNCTPRWEETKKISEYVDKNYDYKKLITKNDTLERISIKNGIDNIEIASKKDIIIPVKKGVDIEVRVKKPLYDVCAPIKQGECIGRVEIYGNNKILFTEGLVAKNFVEKEGYLKRKIYKIKSLLISNKLKNP